MASQGTIDEVREEEDMLATLDEPVSETLMRDLRLIGVKIGLVLMPRKNNLTALRDWDLWGPLLLCLSLAIVLSWNAPDSHQAVLVFSTVFVVVWGGAAVVTVNAVLLGGRLSFFQSVCVLGYCLFPLVIAAILCALWSAIVFRSIVVVVGFLWATGASLGFVTDHLPTKRRALGVYPVLLFYCSLSWMILIE